MDDRDKEIDQVRPLVDSVNQRTIKVRTNWKLSTFTAWMLLARVEAALSVAINLFAILFKEKLQTRSNGGPGLRCCLLVTSNPIQLTPLCTNSF